jgi:hypothetical protein
MGVYNNKPSGNKWRFKDRRWVNGWPVLLTSQSKPDCRATAVVGGNQEMAHPPFDAVRVVFREPLPPSGQ